MTARVKGYVYYVHDVIICDGCDVIFMLLMLRLHYVLWEYTRCEFVSETMYYDSYLKSSALNGYKIELLVKINSQDIFVILGYISQKTVFC